MKHIIAFGASNSKQSINKQFATYAAQQVTNVTVDILDLNDYEMPIYSIDRERANGIHALAHEFKAKISQCDGIIISFAEHNGAYTAAFKNIFDWVSRIEKSVWLEKPMLLLATSPGGRGAIGVLDIAYQRFSYTNKQVIGKFSLPSMHTNFSSEEGILDPELKATFEKLIDQFQHSLS